MLQNKRCGFPRILLPPVISSTAGHLSGVLLSHWSALSPMLVPSCSLGLLSPFSKGIHVDPEGEAFGLSFCYTNICMFLSMQP